MDNIKIDFFNLQYIADHHQVSCINIGNANFIY